MLVDLRILGEVAGLTGPTISTKIAKFQASCSSLRPLLKIVVFEPFLHPKRGVPLKSTDVACFAWFAGLRACSVFWFSGVNTWAQGSCMFSENIIIIHFLGSRCRCTQMLSRWTMCRRCRIRTPRCSRKSGMVWLVLVLLVLFSQSLITLFWNALTKKLLNQSM